MRRCLILVEGQTEEQFVRDCLEPHLQDFNIALIPTIVTTKRVKSGPDFTGGIVRFRQVERDLRRLLGDSSAVVTTMFDYYGLPNDFPGMSDRPDGPPRARVEHVEAAFREQVNHRRFIPYLILHEFEAWVFSDLDACGWVFDAESGLLADVRAQFATPEDINEGRDTAPSKRILAHVPEYQKPLYGPMAVGAIGLDRVRAECEHFHAWLSRLEALVTSV